MRCLIRIRTLATLVLMSALPCMAQYYDEGVERWHLRGSAGVSFFRNTDTPLVNGSGESSTYNDVAGDLGLDLSGFVKDPKFVSFDTNFNLQQGANSSDGADFSNSLLGGGFNVAFLPVSHYPFHFMYQKSAFDTSGSLFGSNSDTSQLNAQWMLDLPNLPRFTFGYRSSSNDVRLATSLSNTGYDQSDWSFQAQDNMKGWVWNAGLNFGNFNANSLGTLVITGTKEDYLNWGGRVYRNFWDNKALFQADFRSERYHYDIQGSGTSDNSDIITSASLLLQHTPKLSSHYYYSFTRVDVSSNLNEISGVTILTLPSQDTQSVGGRVDYQVWQPLRVFQELRYSRLTPLPGTAMESRTALSESFSGATIQKRWRQFDLGGTYMGELQLMGTNLGNQAHTWSNNVDARVGWGEAKKVHLLGTYRYSQFNFIEQLGGFTHDQHYGVQAETTHFWGTRFIGSVEHGNLDILNLSGKTTRDYSNLMFQAEQRKFVFIAIRGFDDGSGAVFPTDLTGRTLITAPLPISQLVGTPLLDRTTRLTSVALTLRLKRNLDIGADWRKEDNILFNSTQDYRIWELRGEYRLGKVTLDGGVGNLRTSIGSDLGNSGLGINRYWFRVRRDFNVF